MATPALADAGNLSAYLKARAAAADGQASVAAAGYARALAGSPDSALIAIRAYREALAVGDEALASRAAAVLDRQGVAPADTALLPLAAAARRNDPKAVDAAIVSLSTGPLQVLAPALRGWSALARHGDALAPVEAANRDAVARRFAAENRVLLLIATGKADAAIAALAALGGSTAPIDLRFAAAQLLLSAGRAEAARALFSGEDAAPATGVSPSLAFGVSRLLTRVAADLAGPGTPREPSPLTIALTRAALTAEPGNDRARLLLADALSRSGAATQALATLDDIPASSPFANAAASARVTVLSSADREPEALAVAAALAQEARATAGDWQLYADLLAAANREGEAATFYRRVLDAGSAGEWTTWLQYGGALDRAGRWPEARAALERAVALAPREPLALNYLAYARIERGEDIRASVRMLERAALLKPDDPSIADSLGWAYLRSGDVARALPLLERAAAGDPLNREIGEHLGDAYWTLGRRFEARYAWSAATLTAEAEDAGRLATKIAEGLPARGKSR